MVIKNLYFYYSCHVMIICKIVHTIRTSTTMVNVTIVIYLLALILSWNITAVLHVCVEDKQ